jgi:hypothetical protein
MLFAQYFIQFFLMLYDPYIENPVLWAAVTYVLCLCPIWWFLIRIQYHISARRAGLEKCRYERQTKQPVQKSRF